MQISVLVTAVALVVRDLSFERNYMASMRRDIRSFAIELRTTSASVAPEVPPGDEDGHEQQQADEEKEQATLKGRESVLHSGASPPRNGQEHQQQQRTFLPPLSVLAGEPRS